MLTFDYQILISSPWVQADVCAKFQVMFLK